MKTILLTSAGTNVKEEILKILPKPANQMKLVQIITASKPEKNKAFVEKDRKGLQEMGFEVEDIDLEGKTEDELRTLLSDKDIIFVQGGNTFYLMKYIRESGFDRIVKELIEKGVIYIGVSAGSYVACPSIEMSYWKHPDRNIVNLTDLSGMNLVSFLLSVHYKPEFREILKKEISKTNYGVKILTDSQAILVRDDKVKLVGMGEEVRI